MKSLFILLTICSSYFAQAGTVDEIINRAALKSFEQTFAGAQEVSWTVHKEGYKVSFQVAGQYASAYYDEAGNLALVARNISTTQLPMVLLAGIKKELDNKWVSELIEVSNDSGTQYYITLEDAGQKLSLKSNGPTNWVRFQKLEK
jgi:hypothetical protein